MRLSIVVPTLNEAAGVVAALETLQPLRAAGHEVVVIDGGSHDGTPDLAMPWASLIESRRKRASFLQAAAHQMALDNVAIEQRRASARTIVCEFDLVTARAFGTSVELYKIAAAALRPGGLLLLYASSGQNLSEGDPGQPFDVPQACAAHFTEPATWTYRLPHRESIAARTAALWPKHRAV